MAIDWSKEMSDRMIGPVGAQQSKGSAAQFDGNWGSTMANYEAQTQGYSQPRWFTGGRHGGTASGYDTPFYRRMFEQMEEQQNLGMGAGSIYNREDYTGIVTSDALKVRSVGKESGAQFGDIFNEGKRVGNIYDAYDKSQAESLLADMMLEKNEKQRVFAAADPNAISDAVARARRENTQRFESSITQAEYAGRVEARQEDLLKHDGFTAATTAAGVVGGAAAFLGLAGLLAAPLTGGASVPLGLAAAAAVGGGAAGGVGAWLNRDQVSEEAARAMEQWEMQSDGEHGSQAATGLMNWSALGMKALLPLSNLYQGGYDAAKGSVGDAESEFYRFDPVTGRRKASGLAQALGFGTTLLDAAGMGGGVKTAFQAGGKAAIAAGTATELSGKYVPSAMGIYQLSMSGSIIGGVGELTLGQGYKFSDEKGVFESAYDHGFWAGAAAWGSSAIDVAQLGLARGLSGKVRASQAQAADGWQKLSPMQKRSPFTPVGAEYQLEQKGLRFFQTADGQLIDKVRRPITTWVAPSELTDSVLPRYWAVRGTAMKNGAVSADQVYKAASRLMSGDHKLTSSIINGLGEGVEEFVQAYFDAWALGEDSPDPMQATEAALAGFLLGAGMSAGTSMRQAPTVATSYQVYSMFTQAAGDKPLTFEEFKELSGHEQRLELVASIGGEKFANQVASDLKKSMVMEHMATQGGVELLMRAYQTQQEFQDGRLNQSMDSKLLLSGSAAGSTRNEAVEFSFARLSRVMRNQVSTFERDLKRLKETEGASPRSIDFVARAHDFAEQIRDVVAAYETSFEDARKATDLQKMRDVSIQVNLFLGAMYDGNYEALFQHLNPKLSPGDLANLRKTVTLTEMDGIALRRAGSVLMLRNPQDKDTSMLALLPQVNFSLARYRGNNGVYLNHSVLDMIAGDYDGDTLDTALHMSISEEAFRQLRSGQRFTQSVSTEGKKGELPSGQGSKTLIKMKDSMQTLASALTGDYEGAGNIKWHVAGYFGTIERWMRNLLVKTQVLTESEMLQFHERYVVDASAGRSDAWETLLNELLAAHATKIHEFGRANFIDLLNALDYEMANALNRFHDDAALLQRTMNRKEMLEALDDSASPEIKRKMARENSFAEIKGKQSATQYATLMSGDTPANSFRGVQGLNYSAARAAEVGAASKDIAGQRAALQDWWLSFSQDLPVEVEIHRSRNTIAYRGLEILRNQARQAGTGAGMPVSVFQVAATPTLGYEVRGKNDDGAEPRIRLRSSPAQNILMYLVESERAEAARTNVVTQEAEARWKRIESLLHPGKEMEALFELIQAMQVADSGIVEIPFFGSNQTFLQVFQALTAMDPDERGEIIRTWKALPQYKTGVKLDKNGLAVGDYLDTENGGISGFRVAVDLLAYMSNNYVTRDDSGVAGGKIGDRKGGESFRISSKLAKAFESFQKLIAEFVGKSPDQLTIEDVQHAWETNIHLDRGSHSILPLDSAVGMFHQAKDGKNFMTSAEFARLFTLHPDAAVAQLHGLITRAKLAGRVAGLQRAEGIDGEPLAAYDLDTETDRFVRALIELSLVSKSDEADKLIAKRALEAITEKMATAQSIEELMQYWNTHVLRPGEAPFVAWKRDASVVNEDGFDTGGEGFADAQFAENLALFSSASKKLVGETLTWEQRKHQAGYAKTLLAEYQALKVLEDASRAASIKPGLNSLNVDGMKISSPEELPNLTALTNIRGMIHEALRTVSSLGGSARKLAVIALIRGIDKNEPSKGLTNASIAALGAQDAMGGLSQYGNKFDHIMGALTSADASNALANIESLRNSGARLTLDNSGEIVSWDIDDPVEFFLELMQDPKKQAFAEALFLPGVYDLTPGSMDRVSKQLIFKSSLEELGKRNPYKEFKTLSKPQKMALLASEMSNISPTTRPMEELLATIGIAVANSDVRQVTESSLSQLVDDTNDFVTDLMMFVGQMTPELRSQVRDSFKEKLVNRRETDWSFIEKRSSDAEQSLLDKAIQSKLTGAVVAQTRTMFDLTRKLAMEKHTLTIDETEKLENELAVVKESLERSDSLKDILEKEFRMDFAVWFANYGFTPEILSAVKKKKLSNEQQESKEATQARLLRYVSDNFQSMEAMNGTDTALLRKFKGLTESKSTFEPSWDNWQELSNLTITHVIHQDLAGLPAKTILAEYPGADSEFAKFWDPSYSYLADYFFSDDSTFVQASQNLIERTGYADETVSIEAVDKLLENFFKSHRLRTWTPATAGHSQHAIQTLSTSGTNEATPRSGNIPKTLLAEHTFSFRTSENIPDEMYSQVEFKGAFEDLHSTRALIIDGNPVDASIKVKRVSQPLSMSTTEYVSDPAKPDIMDVPVKVSFAEMHGRLVRGLTISISDGKKTQVLRTAGGDVNFVTDPLLQSALQKYLADWVEEGAPAAYFLSAEVLQARLPAVLEKALLEDGTPANAVLDEKTRFSIGFDYVNDLSLPAFGKDEETFGNNVGFEGIINNGSTDSAPSLISELSAAIDGIMNTGQQKSLQALKKNLQAYTKAFKDALFKNKSYEDTWDTDFAGMLREKARYMATEDSGGWRLGLASLNATMKKMKNSHWVRGRDADNKLVLLSAEKVIQWQLSNPGESIKDHLQDAELYTPSPGKLRQMLGDSMGQGLTTDISKVALPYTTEIGKRTQEKMVENDPSLNNFGKSAKASDYFASRVTMLTKNNTRRADGTRLAALVPARLVKLQERHRREHQRRADKREYEQITKSNKTAREKAVPLIEKELKTNGGRSLSAAGFGESISRKTSLEQQRYMAANGTGAQDGLSRTVLIQALDDSDLKAGKSAPLGVYTQLEFLDSSGNSKKTDHRLVQTDMALVDVRSFIERYPDEETAYSALLKIVTDLANSGVTISLIDEKGERDMRDRLSRAVRKYEYEPARSSSFVLLPTGVEGETQNITAFLSTGEEQYERHAHNLAIGISTNLAGTMEGSLATITERPFRRPFVINTSLFPAGSLKGFNLPRGEQIPALKASLKKQLESQDFIDHLHNLNGKGDRGSLNRDIASLKNWLGSDSHGEYLIPTELRLGTFIPLFDPLSGVVYLHRWGHKTGHRTFKSQLGKPAPQSTKDNPQFYKVVIGSSVVDHNISSYEGNFVKLVEDNRHGFKVSISVQLQALATKFQEDGIKLTIADNTFKYRFPNEPIFPGQDAIGALDSTLLHGKGGHQEVKDFNRLFQIFGHNPEAHLAKTLLGIDMSKIQTEQELAHVREKVHNVMEFISKNIEKYDASFIKRFNNRILLKQSISSTYTNIGDFFANLQSEMSITLNSRLNEFFDKNFEDLSKDLDEFVTFAVISHLSTKGSKWRDIEGFAGLADYSEHDEGAVVRKMKENYTDLYQLYLKEGSQARKDLFNGFNRKFTQINIGNNEALPEYWINEDFSLSWQVWDGKKFVREYNPSNEDDKSYLVLFDLTAVGDSPTLLEQAERRRNHDIGSAHNMALQEMVNDGRILYDVEKRTGLDLSEVYYAESETDSLMNIYDAISPENGRSAKLPTFRKHWRTQHQRAELDLNQKALITFRHSIDRSDWPKEGTTVRQVNAKLEEIYALLDMRKGEYKYVDFWVRQWIGLDANVETGFKKMEINDYLAAVDAIHKNLREGKFPIAGGQVRALAQSDLLLLYRKAQQQVATGKTVKFLPLGADGVAVEVGNLDAWVEAMFKGLVEASSVTFDPLYLRALDGIMNTYHTLGAQYQHLPISLSVLKEAGYANDKNELAISINKDRNEVLNTQILFEANDITIQELQEGPRIPTQTADAAQERGDQRRRRWRRQTETPEMKKVDFRKIQNEGLSVVDKLGTDNAFLQGIIQLRVINALGNPALPVSALGEAFIWGNLSDMADLLTGNSANLPSRALKKLQGSFEKITGKSVAEMTNNFLGASTLSYEDAAELNSSAKYWANTVPFRTMISADTNFQTPQGRGMLTRLGAIGTNFVSKLQEPQYGMRPTVLGRRYAEGVVAYATGAIGEGTVLTPRYVIQQLKLSEGLWAQKHFPEAHAAGLRAIEDPRGLKATPMSLMIQGIVNPLADNGRPFIGIPATLLLKVPTLFSTYAMNVASKVFGLQGPNALIAMALHGRKKFWKMEGADDAYLDMSRAIESVDLQKEFMQSTLSLTSLFVFGLMASSFGLSGEDEETKRRRRMAKAQNWDFLYDPRQLQNDWRNQDAIFFDNIGFLKPWFAVTTGDEEGGQRSMASMHWMVKQFASPVMGFERFFDTGDIRQIIWGFQDALNSFPLLNLRQWQDTVALTRELATAAETEASLGTADGLPQAFKYTTNLVMMYERMLFENSFLNQLYIGSDDYDRDPYLLPELSREGVIQTDRNGNPILTKALSSYLDEDSGEVRQGYLKRDTEDAIQAGYAERQLSYSIFKSLTSGQLNWLESSYNRHNMPVKQRKIDLEPIDMETAQDLVFSLYNKELDQELLTYSGARTILNGIAIGTLTLDSPALRGIFLTREQRKQISVDWIDDLTQEGIHLYEMEEWAARRRAYDIWLGQGDYAGAPSLQDILWTQQIPWGPQVKYNQLNTTYIQGPDGQMWATGITRDKLMTALGLNLFPKFRSDTSNMTSDQRLNSTDEVYNLNTGLRSLERVDESWDIPSQEEIIEDQTRALEEAMNKSVKDIKEALADGEGWIDYSGGYGSYRYAAKGWSSGGGGGYGSTPRISTAYGVREANQSDVRTPQAGRPNIRRSSIRRERYTSTKGRLKPWQ